MVGFRSCEFDWRHGAARRGLEFDLSEGPGITLFDEPTRHQDNSGHGEAAGSLHFAEGQIEVRWRWLSAVVPTEPRCRQKS